MATLDHIKIFNQKEIYNMKHFSKQLCLLLACLLCLSASLCGCGEDFRVMVLPDHPTPVRLRTHTILPVPYFIYDSAKACDGVTCFCEESATAKNNYLPRGHELMKLLMK